MKIGFTGSRWGMSEVQRQVFEQCISFMRPTEFHHGDCIGADLQAATIVRRMFPQCKIVNHVPTKDELRGNFVGDENRDPLPYLDRDRNIVDETDALIATPNTEQEQERSGTWFTINYADKQQKNPIGIIYPSGRKERRGRSKS